MTEQQIQSLIVRALKTFLQAFFSVILLALTPAFNVATLKALLIAAVAAGISALMNAFLKPTEAK